MKKHLANYLLFFGSIAITLLIAEFGFRMMLFGNSEAFKKLRDPGLYADYFNEDDYWKLYYLFGGEYKPPANPHPLLGWIGDFHRNSLLHNRVADIQNRRPVLLYGDSYAQCVQGVTCFQDILNNDSSFSREHYLLNYGVGGYGVDQIALLYKKTAHRFEKPFVIFSLMVSDLDRTPLSVRTGQKPLFAIQGDSVILKNVPLEGNPDEYFKKNPPEIKSYLWRRFLNSDMNFLPKTVTAKLKRERKYTDEKIRLNEKVLDAVLKDLRDHGVNFMFIVFHYIEPGNQQFSVEDENNWRDNFLREYMEKNKIPYVWTKELIRKDPSYDGKNIEKFMILENGHPTTYFNGLIASEMKSKLLELEALEDGDPSPYISKMMNDSVWSAAIRQKAKEKGVSFDEMAMLDAAYLVKEKQAMYGTPKSAARILKEMSENSAWMNDLKKKAAEAGRSLEEQMKLDADYLVRSTHPVADSTLYMNMISEEMLKVRNSPDWMERAVEKARQENKSIDRSVLDEAVYSVGQRTGIYSFTW